MKKKPLHITTGIVALAAGGLICGAVFLFGAKVFAWNGPSSGCTPPNCYGAIGSDAANDISIGTSTPLIVTKFSVVGSTTDSSAYAQKLISSNYSPLILVRNDAAVSIETSTMSAGNTIIGGNLIVGGTINASNLAGNVAAGNVLSGQFGANTGGGNYYFPNYVGIGTTTAGYPLDIESINNAEIILNDTSAGGVPWYIEDSAAGNAAGGGKLIINTSNSTVNGPPPLTIASSGNVGIDTYAPTAALSIGNNAYTAPLGASYAQYQILLNDSGSASTSYGIGVESGGNIGFNSNGGYKFYQSAGVIPLMVIGGPASANVGIGTTTPAYKLDVAGAGSFEGNIIHNVGTPVASSDVAIKSYVDSAISGGSGPWTLNGTNVYTSNNNYNVGIGTSTPMDQLVVTTNNGPLVFGNNTGATMRTGGGSALVINGVANSNLYFNRDVTGVATYFQNGIGTYLMTIASSGNVGIGTSTSTPAYKLDVNGAGSFENGQIHFVGTPTAPADAATKSYVDSAISTVTSSFGGTVGHVPYYTSASVLGDSIMFQTSSQIGINTTTPGNLLAIQSTGASTNPFEVYNSQGNPIAYIRDASGHNAQFNLYNNNSIGTIVLSGSTSTASYFNAGNIGIGSASGAVNQLEIFSNGTSRNPFGLMNTLGNQLAIIRDDSGDNGDFYLYSASNSSTAGVFLSTNATVSSYLNVGNLGVGTTTPAYQLDVAGAASFENYVIHNVGTPVAAADAATKNYVDTAIAFVTSSISGTPNYIPYYTSATTLGNSNIDQSGGNVGVAVAGPVATFQVGSGATSTAFYFAGNLNGGTVFAPGQGAWLEWNGAPLGLTGATDFINNEGGGTGGWEFVNTNATGTVLSTPMVILGSGNVGIGTTTPQNVLDAQLNQNNATRVQVTNATAGTLARSVFWATNDAGAQGQFGVVSSAFATNTVITAGNTAYVQSNGGPFLLQAIGAYPMNFATNGSIQLSIAPSGNVGINTSTAAYTLEVGGSASFDGNVVHGIGTPVAAADAATKNYVDTAITGVQLGNFMNINVTSTATINGQLILSASSTGINMNGRNITAVGTLQVTTIDPSYSIGGTDYETFAPSIEGVQDEVTGNGTLTKSGSDYVYTVNFSTLPQGSDLWVWYQTVDFGKDTVEAIATPYGQFAEIYYTINANTLTFHGNAPAQFSFRLTGQRYDWQKWPTRSADQSESATVLPVKD